MGRKVDLDHIVRIHQLKKGDKFRLLSNKADDVFEYVSADIMRNTVIGYSVAINTMEFVERIVEPPGDTCRFEPKCPTCGLFLTLVDVEGQVAGHWACLTPGCERNVKTGNHRVHRVKKEES